MSQVDFPPRTWWTVKSLRLYGAAVSAVLLLGALLRVLGYFGGIEFWWDEAMWVELIEQGRSASIRPPGYVWVSRWLIDLRNTEPVIRAPSLIAGILGLPVFLAMCRASGLSRLVSLFGLFVLAVHPAAIDLSKEFKPYALELFLHLLLLWLAFSFLRSPKTWRAVTMGLAATLAAPFSWSIVVLFPGLFATTGLSALRRRSAPQRLAILVGAMSSLAAMLAGYLLHYRDQTTEAEYWGEKYGIFYLGSDLHGLVSWMLQKTWEVATFPAHLKSFWLDPAVVQVFWILQGALCLLGVVAIVATRRWDRAGLWLSPWLITIVLNVLGLWPYGVFRTNLFLLAYGLPVSLAGLDGLRRWLATRSGSSAQRGRWLVPAVCGLYALAFVPVDLGFFAEGKSSGMAGNCHVHQALETMYEAERDEPKPAKARRFLLDDAAYDAFVYYRDFHATASAKYKEFLDGRYRPSRRYQPLEQAIDWQVKRGFWLLTCRPGHMALIRSHAQDRCSQIDHLRNFRFDGLLLRCRGDAQR